MSFFEPPDPEPERAPEPVYRMPARFGPTDGVLPGIAPVEILLAKTDDVAVGLGRISAYPAGFELEVSTKTRIQLELEPFDFGFRHRRKGGDPGPELLRFGIQFSDGRKVTNLEGGRFGENESSEGPVMTGHGGGGGGGGSWSQHQWVWPLPPEGPLTFACEWPAVGIPLTTIDIDASLIIDAAQRAVILWDLPDAPHDWEE